MCQASARTVVPSFETSRVACEDEKMLKVNTNKKALAVKRDAKCGIFSFFIGAGFLNLGLEDAGSTILFPRKDIKRLYNGF